MSRRPTVTTRGNPFGRTSKIVGRPSGSRVVVTTPAGLWKRNSRVRSTSGSGALSTSTRSVAETLNAGELSTLPFTFTRPSAIIASASRREATPARARRLAIRSPATAPASGAAPARAAAFVGLLDAERLNRPSGLLCFFSGRLPFAKAGADGRLFFMTPLPDQGTRRSRHIAPPKAEAD